VFLQVILPVCCPTNNGEVLKEYEAQMTLVLIVHNVVLLFCPFQINELNIKVNDVKGKL